MHRGAALTGALHEGPVRAAVRRGAAGERFDRGAGDDKGTELIDGTGRHVLAVNRCVGAP